MFKLLTALFFLTFSNFSFSSEVKEEQRTFDVTSDYSMVGDLSDCKIYLAKNNGWKPRNLFITVCPNKDTNTNYKSGKLTQNVANISKEKKEVTNIPKSKVTLNEVEYYSKKDFENDELFEQIKVNGETYYKLKEL